LGQLTITAAAVVTISPISFQPAKKKYPNLATLGLINVDDDFYETYRAAEALNFWARTIYD
jgi:hypothetical protein